MMHCLLKMMKVRVSARILISHPSFLSHWSKYNVSKGRIADVHHWVREKETNPTVYCLLKMMKERARYGTNPHFSLISLVSQFGRVVAQNYARERKKFEHFLTHTPKFGAVIAQITLIRTEFGRKCSKISAREPKFVRQPFQTGTRAK
jgi:hypothetical protein